MYNCCDKVSKGIKDDLINNVCCGLVLNVGNGCFI